MEDKLFLEAIQGDEKGKSKVVYSRIHDGTRFVEFDETTERGQHCWKDPVLEKTGAGREYVFDYNRMVVEKAD
ncbi:hypothetical protein U1Q18_040109 [Sarracenia purpurea var. burkii]